MAFISEQEVLAELSEVTVERLFDDDGDGVIDSARLTQYRVNSCSRVTTLIKGYTAEMPTAVTAPREWKRLALRHLISQVAIDYPGYFRVNGLALQQAVEKEIVATRAIEPTDNQVATASDTTFVPWS